MRKEINRRKSAVPIELNAVCETHRHHSNEIEITREKKKQKNKNRIYSFPMIFHRNYSMSFFDWKNCRENKAMAESQKIEKMQHCLAYQIRIIICTGEFFFLQQNDQ